jgi:hypothetical protein
MLPDRKEVCRNKYKAVEYISFAVYIKYASFPSCNPVECIFLKSFSCFLFWFFGS